MKIFGDGGCLYLYRCGRFLYKRSPRLGLSVARLNQFFYGCYISPATRIGNIHIGHPVGLVIAGDTVIEDGCVLNHNVLIGVKEGKMKVIIKENCVINTNTVIVGDVTIGKNCIIGAGSYIDKDVPDNTIIHPKFEMVLKPNTRVDELM